MQDEFIAQIGADGSHNVDERIDLRLSRRSVRVLGFQPVRERVGDQMTVYLTELAVRRRPLDVLLETGQAQEVVPEGLRPRDAQALDGAAADAIRVGDCSCRRGGLAREPRPVPESALSMVM